MSICPFCHRDSEKSVSCAGADWYDTEDEIWWYRIPTRIFCLECGVQAEGYHHLGCGNEPCPKCSGKVTDCPCQLVLNDVPRSPLDLAPKKEDSK